MLAPVPRCYKLMDQDTVSEALRRYRHSWRAVVTSRSAAQDLIMFPVLEQTGGRGKQRSLCEAVLVEKSRIWVFEFRSSGPRNTKHKSLLAALPRAQLGKPIVHHARRSSNSVHLTVGIIKNGVRRNSYNIAISVLHICNTPTRKSCRSDETISRRVVWLGCKAVNALIYC